MQEAPAWPVRVASLGMLSPGAVLWRIGGQLMATIVVKATLALVPNGTMVVVAPGPLRREDEYGDGPTARQVIGASELAPQLQRADVVMVAHAYPTPAASQCLVRLAIGNASGTLFDKVLLVRGELGEDGATKPFIKMPLDYEHSYGGAGWPANPLGRGHGSKGGVPNVVYPDGHNARTACFLPVPHAFRVRRQLLRSTARSALVGPIATIPDDFDWNYYQSAPQDQQLARLTGTEWLTLDGVHPSLRSIRTQLPDLDLAVMIFDHDQAGLPSSVPLRPDMLVVDADAMKCSLIWRGSFPVPRPEALAQVVVAVALESADEPALWPESAAELDIEPYQDALADSMHGFASGNLTTQNLEDSLPRHGATMVLEPEASVATVGLSGRGEQAAALPVATIKRAPVARGNVATTGLAALPGAGWSRAPGAAEPVLKRASTTQQPPREGATEQPRLSVTQPVTGEPAAAEQAFPFKLAEGGPPKRKPPPIQLPGAPWNRDDVSPTIASDGRADLWDPAAEMTPSIYSSSATLPPERPRQQAAAPAYAEPEDQAADKAEAERLAAEAERLAAEEAQLQLELQQAEQRRQVEAERFRKQQAEAEAREQRREQEAAKAKREEAEALRRDMYSDFRNS